MNNGDSERSLEHLAASYQFNEYNNSGTNLDPSGQEPALSTFTSSFNRSEYHESKSKHSNDDYSATASSTLEDGEISPDEMGGSIPNDTVNEAHNDLNQFPVPDGFMPSEIPQYCYNLSNPSIWFDRSTSLYSLYHQESNSYIPFDPSTTDLSEIGVLQSQPISDLTLRLVVLSSDVFKDHMVAAIDAGGATIGRDRGFDKVLRIPEMPVSKIHATIYVGPATDLKNELDDVNGGDGNLNDEESGQGSKEPYQEISDKAIVDASPKPNESFFIVDVGSTTGTFLNSTRLSPSKHASQPFPLSHGDILQIGSTLFSIHLHRDAWGVCDECKLNSTGENYLSLDGERPKLTEPRKFEKAKSKEEIEAERREEKRRLKDLFVGRGSISSSSQYRDRAAVRRDMFGLDVPGMQKDETADIESLNMAKGIDTNEQRVELKPGSMEKGQKLLEKMGWKEGEGLTLAKVFFRKL
ncbi:hypothetical protein BKA69DRAFT_1062322 [Paraphysoderma sedebokerense]|nr:hypothetical protein BKA69DRAFT_1062322 [Paraphysoderma sedebokerense]